MTPGLMAPDAPRLVLASGSATRRALMEAAGLVFDVVAPEVDEGVIKAAMRAEGESPEATALALADAKAAWIPDEDALVIGADQILVCEGEWFGKPRDMAGARAHLLRLRGRRHELVTAVTCWRGGARVWCGVACPTMQMRAFSDAFVDRYLAEAGEAVLGSVGAYRVEELGVQLFDGMEGEHSAVLGLPMLALLNYLRGCGVTVA